MTPARPSLFSQVNGREIYDNGQVRIWRCPVCEWWREWLELQCPACRTKRDGAVVEGA